jgi:hypothetical protein
MTTPDTTPAKRQCYWIPAEPWDEKGFVPFLVTEDEPWPKPLAGNPAKFQTPWYWGTTYPEAKAYADQVNLDDFGITPDQMAAILLSSMRAQRAARR